jgi:uncharacterized membrane protein YfcA
MLFGFSAFDIAILFGSGLIGAAVNAIAGGGTFFTFPAFQAVLLANPLLVPAGIGPSVLANSSNAVALFPGRLTAIAAYVREIKRQGRRAAISGVVSVMGGLVGALLLLRTGDGLFLRIVPWLMLAATLLFLFDGALQRRFAVHRGEGAELSAAQWVLLSVPIFLCAVYGGFFAGGLGILMMPFLSMSGVKFVHELNGLKNLLVTLVTSVAVVSFIVAGAVSWGGTLVMAIGAIIGGYAGGHLAKRIPGPALKKAVIACGFGLFVYYFWKAYLA